MTNTQDARDLYLQLRRAEDEMAVLRRMAQRLLPDEAKPDSSKNFAFERLFPGETIFHITSLVYFESLSSERPYLSQTYAKDGFIHCTRGADLMVFVANKHYRSVPGDFAMLVLDVRALTSPLKYEALDPGMLLPFPHIYGPINRDAIVDVVKMPRSAEGVFLAPPFSA